MNRKVHNGIDTIMADKVYNEAMCEKAEQIFGAGKSIARLATELKVSRATIYDWCDKHPEFSAAVERGRDAAQSRWEDIGEAGACGEIDKFSAPTWIFTMKNRFRADYKEDKQVDVATTSLVEKLIDKLVE